MDEIMAKLDWSKPRQVPTKRGPRLVSSAKPNNDVFALFEREKDALYKAGYSISQFRGAWQVSRWVELPAEAIAKIEETKALSRATDADIQIPLPEGLSFLGFQKAGIARAMQIFGLATPALAARGSREDANRDLQKNAGDESRSAKEFGEGANVRSPQEGGGNDSSNRYGRGLARAGLAGDQNTNARSGGSGSASRGTQEGTSQLRDELSGGQRATGDGSGEGSGAVSDPVGVRPAIGNQDERAQNEPRGGNLVQGGLRSSGGEDSDRAGRSESSSVAGEGSKKDGGLVGARLESGENKAQNIGVLLADEQGLGKTVQAIGLFNLVPEAKRILIVCPASLKINWAREVSKWSVVKRPIMIADAKIFPNVDGVVVCNYDILHKHRKRILEIEWDFAVCDEAHFLKEAKSRRAKQVFGARATRDEKKQGMADVPGIIAKRRILLTGTPIPNRPREIFPLIEYLDPERWGGQFFKFGLRYCAGHKTRFGWDFEGSSHLDELQDVLRTTVMIRRLKKDVLSELPPKRRQVLEFPAEGKLAALVEQERDAYEEQDGVIAELHSAVEMAKASDVVGEYESAVENLRKGIGAVFGSISTMRLQLAEAKSDLCIEHIKTALEGSPKIVLFAHHKILVSNILAAFPGEIVSIVGDTAMGDRQAAVDRFQKDPTCKLIIGSFGAMGVGHTLTAAAHVVCCELDWVPGNVSQAEDRCHRIGQKNSVLVQHLVVEGSLDATIAKRIVSKQNIIDEALDEIRAKIEAEPLDLGAKKDRSGATIGTPKEQIEKDALSMTEDQRAAVKEALRFLAERCNGARDWDGAGFSKIDAALGRDLASRPFLSPKQAALGRRVVKKYARTQLSEALAARLQ